MLLSLRLDIHIQLNQCHALSGSHIKRSNERASGFGRKLVVDIFQGFPPARAEILDIIQARLIGNRSDNAASYLPLLISLVDGCPANMCEHASRLKVCSSPKHNDPRAAVRRQVKYW